MNGLGPWVLAAFISLGSPDSLALGSPSQDGADVAPTTRVLLEGDRLGRVLDLATGPRNRIFALHEVAAGEATDTRITMLADPEGDGSFQVTTITGSLGSAGSILPDARGIWIAKAPDLLWLPTGQTKPIVTLSGFSDRAGRASMGPLALGIDGSVYGIQSPWGVSRVRELEFQSAVWRFDPSRGEFRVVDEDPERIQILASSDFNLGFRTLVPPSPLGEDPTRWIPAPPELTVRGAATGPGNSRVAVLEGSDSGQRLVLIDSIAEPAAPSSRSLGERIEVVNSQARTPNSTWLRILACIRSIESDEERSKIYQLLMSSPSEMTRDFGRVSMELADPPTPLELAAALPTMPPDLAENLVALTREHLHRRSVSEADIATLGPVFLGHASEEVLARVDDWIQADVSGDSRGRKAAAWLRAANSPEPSERALLAVARGFEYVRLEGGLKELRLALESLDLGDDPSPESTVQGLSLASRAGSKAAIESILDLCERGDPLLVDHGATLLPALGATPSSAARSMLTEIVAAPWPLELRRAALQGLNSGQHDDAGKALVRWLTSAEPGDPLAFEVVESLVSSRPWSEDLLLPILQGDLDRSWLRPEIIDALILHQDPRLELYLRRILGGLPALRRPGELARTLAASLEEPEDRPSDSDLGSRVFGARCAACHPNGSSGAAFEGTDPLIQSLIGAEGLGSTFHRETRLETQEGRVWHGVVDRRATRVLGLRAASGFRLSIPRSRLIDPALAASESGRAGGTLNGIEPGELAALLEYLRD